MSKPVIRCFPVVDAIRNTRWQPTLNGKFRPIYGGRLLAAQMVSNDGWLIFWRTLDACSPFLPRTASSF